VLHQRNNVAAATATATIEKLLADVDRESVVTSALRARPYQF
jgi:hypothetical protein